ncbi:MAG TPA: hypothetical protein VMU51_26195 [Mycobacteriales bacterium]|nr:hypothetical protein [Mycobacteriales bacterium]
MARKHWTLRAVVAAVGATLLVTVGLAGPAQADGKTLGAARQPAGAVPGGFASWSALFSTQDKLHAAASTVITADSSGLGGVVVSAVDREVRVYWKGAVPAATQALAGSLGVTFRFLPARFTERELVAEAQRIAADPRVGSVAAKPDGSGLAVTLAAGAKAGAVDLLGTARIPLTVSTGQRPEALNRQADIPQFWGGARYNSPVGGCSNGFALSVAGAANVFEISAGHCGANGNGVVIPGQPNPTGVVLADVNARDTLAIQYPAGVAPVIYNGPFNSNTGVLVGGAVSDFVGELVCTGGASSGEHCGIQVLAVDVFVNIGIVIGPETFAALPAGQCAVAPGDSGGPVYSYRTDGRVNGRGTVSAGQTGTAVCPGVVPGGSNVVFYAPLLRPAGDPQVGALQFYGVGILT